MTQTQCFGQRSVQTLGIDGTLFQVAFHRFVIHFHNTFDESLVNTFNRSEIGFTLVIVKAVNNVRTIFVRQVKRQHFVSECFTKVKNKLSQVHVRLINFIDNNHAAEVAFFGPVHHASGHQFNAFGGINNHTNRFYGIQCAQCLTYTIRVPRGIQQENTNRRAIVFLSIQVSHSRTQRVLDFFFHRIKVTNGVAFFNSPYFFNDTVAIKQCFHQGCLTGRAVAHQSYSTDILNWILTHNDPL